ncbi:NAD(P)/FAD-dependent oxidoreductase [Defluviimonas aestuarii]|uniref:NAD(P)/FAD-dependent oxidoreductase n=1 Tax=Albidovulum aestuarii TaxID=1130726 RepID=UPI00249A79C4|nr:NAD(P)/FAD-dependent oxidoreductase [Defluviimonas aestuarii]MDI3335628.1 NAD(P)/FAD-dependent oxidoreductase [Defluviimonas aestuarii]
METTDVIIIGAGAAGMMCAVEAGRRGRRVVVLDHARNPGEKIRISGGGRCNFTNLEAPPERFLSGNPRFAISALKRFAPADFIARVDAAGIAWHEKTLGQLFCDGSARQIVDLLVRDMADVSVDLRLGTGISTVSRDGGFLVETSGGMIRAESLVLATGGKSIPKMGATGFAYRIAEQFGLAVTEIRPALVPLTFAEQDLEKLRPLAGVSVEARVTLGRTAFEEGLLFTHRGLSGPSILQISSYWREGDSLTVDLARGCDVAAALKALRGAGGRIAVQTALGRYLPEKVAGIVLEATGVSGRLADQSNAVLDQIGDAVNRWQVKPVGSEGYRTAEVTLGGVDTGGLDARTMEARTVPGLYFIGEAVDVTGWLGGYNFQWAWSSGWAAGQAV